MSGETCFGDDKLLPASDFESPWRPFLRPFARRKGKGRRNFSLRKTAYLYTRDRRFTCCPGHHRFHNAPFELATRCKAHHSHTYNFPRSSTPHETTARTRSQQLRKKYPDIGTLSFLHGV